MYSLLQSSKRYTTIEYLKKALKRGKLLIAGSLLFLMMGMGRVSKAHSSSSSTVVHSSNSNNKKTNAVTNQKNSGKKAIVTLDTSVEPQRTFPQLSLNDDVVVEVQSSLKNLADSIQGAKLDTLILLIVTSTVIPLFKTLNISPIIGFLMTGTALGPTGLNWVKDVHMIDHLGELGIVFFLFEMGLELSLDKLIAMRKDVFGLGLAQFLVTAAVFSLGAMAFGLSAASGIAIGGSLALSSSAFVLQLLKDQGAMGSRHGKASFGILLFQDLAVVPLLIVVELLGKGSSGMGRALTVAGVKAVVTLATLSIFGKKVFDPVFTMVAKSGSQEAFLSVILATVLLMSFVTHGIGLSNTLGAFLAGLLLAETRYHYQIEADIAPFRGLLLGFFFIDVGFSIDIQLLIKEAPKIMMLLVTILTGKAGIITLLSMAFGMPFSSAQQTGLLNAQVGEFAFVAFGIAEKLGLLPPHLSKLLLTSVALSMAATPVLAILGNYLTEKIDAQVGLSRYVGKDESADEVKSALVQTEYVFVCGYGRVGKMICDILDTRFVKYIFI
jgi:monovalent cation:H+ antiporter-2, CPA2 family